MWHLHISVSFWCKYFNITSKLPKFCHSLFRFDFDGHLCLFIYFFIAPGWEWYYRSPSPWQFLVLLCSKNHPFSNSLWFSESVFVKHRPWYRLKTIPTQLIYVFLFSFIQNFLFKIQQLNIVIKISSFLYWVVLLNSKTIVLWEAIVTFYELSDDW